MKKIIIVFVSGVLYASLITNQVNAQRASDASFVDPKIINSGSSDGGKKIAENTAIDPGDKSAIKEMEANLKAAKVNLKVTAHVNKNFKNISGLSWNTEEKVIVATFKMNEKPTRVVYDKKGHWLYTITTFREDQMPGEIRSLVKEAYSGYTISLVHEISQGDITLYSVQLEDCTSYKQVLVYQGEITVYKEFEKSR